MTPQFYGNTDYALQKVLAAIAGGKPPDIAYLYGSWAREHRHQPAARSTSTSYIEVDPSLNWNDFWPAERNVATVNGKIDRHPRARSTTSRSSTTSGCSPRPGISTADRRTGRGRDFENAAIKLTNPAKKQFGWAYVNDASEDTVWRYWAMLWQAGGSILTPDGKQAAFDSPAGVKAMTLLQTLAKHNAIYLDNGSDNYLGRVHLAATSACCGPARGTSARSPGQGGLRRHDPPGRARTTRRSRARTTGSMFNNGSARVQRRSVEFLKWLTSPAIDLKWATMTGDLPIRASVSKLPGYQKFIAKYPGIGEWVAQPRQRHAVAPGDRPPIRRSRRSSARRSSRCCSARRSPSRRSARPRQQVNGILAAPG